MSMMAGVGLSEGPDSYTVGANAAQDAVSQFGVLVPQAFLVFASVQYNQEKMLAGVRSVAKDAVLVGCSTSGEITAHGPVKRHSVVVMALWAKDVSFFSGVGEGIEKNAREAGKLAGAEVLRQSPHGKLDAFLMFPDALAGSGAEIVKGVLEALGKHFPLVGGAAGDDFEFKRTYQYQNERVYSGAVVGLGLSGNVTFGIGVGHGWVPIGGLKKVTRSKGSVLHELDGRPAIKIYEDYFGADRLAELRHEALAKFAITYPLGMRVSGSDELLIRDPLSVDEKGAITCTAGIPEGTEVRLMFGSVEEALKVAETAARSAVERLEGAKPRAVIIFNSIARSKLFGERGGEEIEAIQKAVGRETPLIGFYTYGEQAPLQDNAGNRSTGRTAFHNETVVVCVLGER